MPLPRAARLLLEPGSDGSHWATFLSSAVSLAVPSLRSFDYFDPFRCLRRRSLLCLGRVRLGS
jgi:hypothetical protein